MGITISKHKQNNNNICKCCILFVQLNKVFSNTISNIIYDCTKPFDYNIINFNIKKDKYY